MQILVPSVSRAKQRSSCAILFASHYLSSSRRLCLLRTQNRSARAARRVIPPLHTRTHTCMDLLTPTVDGLGQEPRPQPGQKPPPGRQRLPEDRLPVVAVAAATRHVAGDGGGGSKRNDKWGGNSVSDPRLAVHTAHDLPLPTQHEICHTAPRFGLGNAQGRTNGSLDFHTR